MASILRKRRRGSAEKPEKPACCCHILENCTEKTCIMTKVRWDTNRKIAKEWLSLNGREALTVKPMSNLLDVEYSELESLPSFHPSCYKRFTDKRQLFYAKERQKKSQKNLEESNESGDVLSPKRLRSRTEISASQPKAAILPKVCLICKKEVSYITVAKKRVKDKLAKAETESCGRLREAAELKRDESILVHIRDKDCVAIEARYHHSCYKKYTRFLFAKKQDESTSETRHPFAHTYKLFCETVITKQLLEGQEVMRMTKLLKIFQKMVEKHEALDASSYRSYQLKRRLKADFPQISFHRPGQQNTSDFVYVETLQAGDVFDKFHSDSEVFSSSETDVGSSSPEHARTGQYCELSTLYLAGIIVKSALRDKQGMQTPWPPTSECFTVEDAHRVVPNELFNLLAWIVGASEYATMDRLQEMSSQCQLKLLSICQDIVYLASNGRKQTPKSLALGLTIRHLTGSSQVLNILNSLGHTASFDTILNFETSLAQLQLQQEKSIPKGFCEGVPTIFVWDNIDFGEETLSGAGTTHHTNGILVQRSISMNVEEEDRPVIAKKQRYFAPPPTVLEQYHQKKRQGPRVSSSEPMETEIEVAFNQSKSLDEIYAVIKSVNQNKNVLIPGWKGFNMSLQSTVLPKSAIYYLPVIEASPTEMATVQTIFKNSLDMADKLKLETVMLVFDLIYAKAQQIRWNDEYLAKRTVVRLGEFHTCMSFLAVIGKRFNGAGLQDILVEAGVVAQGSINGVISGHHYNRSMRAHKLMYEALHHLRFRGFLESLPNDKMIEYEEKSQELLEQFLEESLVDNLESATKCDMMTDYANYIETQSSSNPTFHFWSSYLDMVQLLLVFVRATCMSNWKLHLTVVRKMMPWYFSYDRVNYARYLPAYWLEMINLHSTHPECYQAITDTGEWTVQWQGREPFSSIACNQAIEQTVNRDSKTKGGLKGITLRKGAVQRWVLAQPEKAAITRQCESMAGMAHDERASKELDRSKIKKDDDAVKSIVNTVLNMVNPFDDHDELVSLSSGMIASDEVKNDLLDGEKKGEVAVQNYIKTRLIDKEKYMFSPIASMKLKTFTDQKKVKKSSKEKQMIMKNDRGLFARLLIISQKRDINLREILAYPLGTISFPLGNVDGTLAKNTKSELLSLLKSRDAECLTESVPICNALMIDGMATIQSLRKPLPPTFGELADLVLSAVLSTVRKYKSARVDFVADTYPDISIKNTERERRAIGGAQIIQIYGKDQKVPTQWKKFLSSGVNKENLINFFSSCWKTASFQSVKQNLEIFVTHGKECQAIVVKDGESSVKDVPELYCDHEEADTRLLLHAKHASLSHKDIIINSPDTDVAVIAISHVESIKAGLFFLTGVKNRVRIINLHTIANTLSPESCRAMIGIHVFTGCDSVSAFHGKGKKKPLSLALGNDDFIKVFCHLGESFGVDERTENTLEKYVCQLYGHNLSSVNETRYSVFRTNPKATEQSLPPTRDALKQHILRANYQAAIHRRALHQQISAPSLNGWNIADNEISINWMTGSPAPRDVLKLINCKCRTNKCESNRCSCRSSQLVCTDLCQCEDCSNKSQASDEVDVSDSDEDSETD